MTKRISYLDCPHNNVDGYTCCCSDCGYNIYTTEAEYKKDLIEEARRKGFVDPAIRELERKLGIG